MKRKGIHWVLLLTCAAAAPVAAHGQGTITPVAAKAAQLSFDQPLAWMNEAKTNFGAVKDYSCLLTTRENVNGALTEKSLIQFKMMTQPFCVHMRWLAPKKDEGQEVAYIRGKNNDRMRVKSSARLGKIIGFISIDVDDPRVLQNSRHTIREAGIGNMIDETLRVWEMERALGKSLVKAPVAAKVNGVDCIKLEVLRLVQDKRFPYSRTIIYLDQKSKMPIHLENYGWTDGALLEEFSYSQIEWNTGLKEAQFSK